ncbi:MAG: hypothetical protein EOO06_19675, partial [Chitinophagaceae bacterium]
MRLIQHSFFSKKSFLFLCLLGACCVLGTTSKAQYRTRSGGNWASSSNWEYLELGAWYPAIVAPGPSSGDIYIQPGHTITVNSARSIHRLHVGGVLEMQAGGSVNITNQSAVPGELEVQPGGVLRSTGANFYSNEIIYGSGSQIHILSNGKITVGSGGPVAGTDLHGYASNGSNIWEDGARFEWNSSSVLPGSGVTFFPGIAANVKPLLIVSNSGAYIGGALPTTINGKLEVENTFTLSGAGAKYIRDGITGSGLLTVEPGSGDIILDGPAPILGGRNLRIVADDYFYIPNGLTIPTDSSVSLVAFAGSVFTGKGTNHFTVNGTIDMGLVTIENPAGAVNINGVFKTAHPGGLEGGCITANSVVNVNNNSTVEYTAPGNQAVTGTNVLEGAGAYYNVFFSGTGIKSLAGPVNIINHLRISGTVIVDALLYNIGSPSTAFTMTGGRLQLGQGGLQPQMGGAYNITAGAVQFAKNGGAQLIRGGTGYQYHDIEIAGDQVGIA